MATMLPLLATLAIVPIACRSGAGSNSTATAGTVVMRLERGPCFGRCPEYLVEILEDGTVRFDGRKNVNALGPKQAKIAVDDVRRLQDLFARSGFATLDSAYIEGAKGCGRFFTDGPSAILGALVGSSMKSVRHDSGCTDAPRVLQTLAAQVDSVARTSAWTAGAGDNK